MLARKRGAARNKARKMAKKAGAALQTEVNIDEEWENVLQREGLLVVDIYSEWSGPCTGMVSILKKVKMEIGGDNLSYALAKCDTITSLARFRGRSEPTWMFIRNGKTINIMFGANCPKLLEILTKELKLVETGRPSEISVPVTEPCPAESERMKAIEEAKQAREAEKNAKIEAEAKKKYEAFMEHLTTSLAHETFVILFPWIFKDEEGNKKDKKHCHQYTELAEQLNKYFYVEQELRKDLDRDILEELQRETNYVFSNETAHMLMDGKSMCIRLKAKFVDEEVEPFLIALVYGADEIATSPDELSEGCYVQQNLPPLRDFDGVACEESVSENAICLTTIWIPFNARNKAIAFNAVFAKYLESQYPYEDTTVQIPITVFKYDSTRRQDLQVVLDQYSSEVVNFGIFERDKLPNPKLVAMSIKKYEEMPFKSSYEVFVAVIKKVGPEAFLSFAGIGPYHVSENPEIAIEEAQQYFGEGDTLLSSDEDDQNEGEGLEDDNDEFEEG